MCNNNTVLFMDQLVSLKCFVGVPALLCFIFFTLHLDCLLTRDLHLWFYKRGQMFFCNGKTGTTCLGENAIHFMKKTGETSTSNPSICVFRTLMCTQLQNTQKEGCYVVIAQSFKFFFFFKVDCFFSKWVNDFHLNCSTTTQCWGFRYDSLWFHSHTSLEVTI